MVQGLEEGAHVDFFPNRIIRPLAMLVLLALLVTACAGPRQNRLRWQHHRCKLRLIPPQLKRGFR